VLLAGVILGRRLSKWAGLALTSDTRIEPSVAKFLSNIFSYALLAVVGFLGTQAYTKLRLRGDIIECSAARHSPNSSSKR
jgi:hypothetical protein